MHEKKKKAPSPSAEYTGPGAFLPELGLSLKPGDIIANPAAAEPPGRDLTVLGDFKPSKKSPTVPVNPDIDDQPQSPRPDVSAPKQEG